jgi:hypothetical protein
MLLQELCKTIKSKRFDLDLVLRFFFFFFFRRGRERQKMSGASEDDTTRARVPTLSVPLTPQSLNDDERTCERESIATARARRRPASGSVSIVNHRR